jgi:hypothetical protein
MNPLDLNMFSYIDILDSFDFSDTMMEGVLAQADYSDIPPLEHDWITKGLW